MRYRLWSSLPGANGNQVSGKKTAGRANHPPGRYEEKRISCPGSPTVVVLHPLCRALYQALCQVFLEVVAVVIPPDVACPAVEIAAAGVAAVSEAAGPVVVFLVVVAVVVSGVAEPVVVFLVVVAVVVSEVADPVVVFVAVAPVADVAEPRASVDIPVVFAVLVPVSVVGV